DNQLEGDVLIPVSELNRLRREIVDEMIKRRSQAPQWTRSAGFQSALAENPVLSAFRHSRAPDEMEQPAECNSATSPECFRGTHIANRRYDPRLIVLVRNLAQLEAVIQSGIETVYCEFEDPKKYRDAVSLFRNSALRTPGQSGSD